MAQDRWSIICLCSHFKPEEGLRPLTTAEFRNLSILLRRYGKAPGDLFQMSHADLTAIGLEEGAIRRLFALLDRVFHMEALVDSYKNMGIHVVTATDPSYFPMMKATLGANCPPVVCCAGNLSLGSKAVMGFVGARDIAPEDGEFAIRAVRKAVSQGFGIVSGGARGVDSISEGEALRCGGFVVEFPAVALLRRMRDPKTARWIEDGRLLLATPVAPNAGFSASLATTRNRMIYAHSHATIVVRATRCTGGTWSGASDALKRGLCPVLCRDYPYDGNQGLLAKGAIPIDHSWNGTSPAVPPHPATLEAPREEAPEQFSIF